MATIDGQRFDFGDLITIGAQGKVLSVGDAESIVPVTLETLDQDRPHVILVAGNQRLEPDHFYLTFKYARGFLFAEDGVLKNGAPWTERTVFNEASLKKLIGLSTLEIQHVEIEDH